MESENAFFSIKHIFNPYNGPDKVGCLRSLSDAQLGLPRPSSNLGIAKERPGSGSAQTQVSPLHLRLLGGLGRTIGARGG